MKIIHPTFDSKEDYAAVYQIIIDYKWVYFGSSIGVKKRISRWKCGFNNPKHLKNINIKQILTPNSIIEFTILELAGSEEEVRRRENHYLTIHKDNPNLLNRCPDATNNKGIKPYFGYTPPSIKKSERGVIVKPVAHFNSEGILIGKYPSIQAAARNLGIGEKNIRKFVNGKKGPYKKTTFKVINPDGSFLEPPKFIPKWNPNKTIGIRTKGKFGGAHNTAKKISCYTINGDLVKTYGAVVEAAKELKTTAQFIHSALSNQRRTAKGYIWKYC